MMSVKARRELLAVVAPRYAQARAVDRERILEEFVLNTGYHRKYAIRLLNHPSQGRGKVKRQRKSKYPAAIRYPLVVLWKAANCICGKR
jgi:hypothetical protein